MNESHIPIVLLTQAAISINSSSTSFFKAVMLSTELGAAGAIEAEVGRGGRDGPRLPAAAAVAPAAAGARQRGDGAPACADLYLARC